jgi:hypothetical protein
MLDSVIIHYTHGIQAFRIAYVSAYQAHYVNMCRDQFLYL